MVKSAFLGSSIPENHTNMKGFFILTNMRKPFLQVCVWIAKSLDI
jgi:hypothetical protein